MFDFIEIDLELMIETGLNQLKIRAGNFKKNFFGTAGIFIRSRSCSMILPRYFGVVEIF